MKFTQRLAFFLFGLLIGGMFLVYFLKAKADARGVSFCYLPNCRVLKDLRSKPFHYSEAASEKLTQSWLDTLDIRNTLKDGDVIFKRSNIPQDGGKLYIIEGKNTKNELITLEVINYEDKVLLKDVKK